MARLVGDGAQLQRRKGVSLVDHELGGREARLGGSHVVVDRGARRKGGAADAAAPQAARGRQAGGQQPHAAEAHKRAGALACAQAGPACGRPSRAPLQAGLRAAMDAASLVARLGGASPLGEALPADGAPVGGPVDACAAPRAKLPSLQFLQPARGAAPVWEQGIEYALSLRVEGEAVEAVTFTLADAKTYSSWCGLRVAHHARCARCAARGSRDAREAVTSMRCAVRYLALTS